MGRYAQRVDEGATARLAAARVALLFGPFELLPGRRLLLRDGQPVKIGSRAFDLLQLLADRPGEVLSKDELIAHAWPNIFVHDTNLKVTISSLRRVLGETTPYPTYIANIPGRGYRFLAAVGREAEGDAPPQPVPAQVSPAPARLSELGEIIGRRREIGEVVGMLAHRRVVSIVGPGGVGKTTVAIAAARRLEPGFPDGLCIVDLSQTQDDQGVPTAVASALGVRGSPTDMTQAVVESLARRRKLVVLDNCEHVVHGVRALASHIARSGTASRLLLTSRERVGAWEETLLQLGVLPFPEAGVAQTVEDALSYPAIQLFLARALEWGEFELKPRQVGVVSQICRRLDGLPLALEIAAAQLGRHMPEALLVMLDDHLSEFDNRNRSAPSRHRTLWVTLDWSYQRLSDDEALIFRFLSVFAGGFDLVGVLAVLGPLGLGAYQATIGLGGLVAKSLVVAEADDTVLHYRLLDSARMYAADQARRDDRLEAVREAYALHLCTLLEQAGEEWAWQEAAQWRSQHRPRLNDVRQALDWCFGASGRPALGFRLTTAALLLWDEVSGVGEAKVRIEQALAHAATGDVRCDPRSVARLARARAWGQLQERRIPAGCEAAWRSAIGWAEQAGDVEIHLKALWGYAVFLTMTGRYDEIFAPLERFRALAVQHDERSVLPDGEWLTAGAEMYLGRLTGARARLEALAKAYPLRGPRTRIARFVVDRSMMLRTRYVFTLWATGEPVRAQAVSDEVSLFDGAAQHLFSQICHRAWGSLPIAVWNGDWLAVASDIATLRGHLEVENIPVLRPVQAFYQALLDEHLGVPDAAGAVRRSIDDIIESRLVARVPSYLGALAEILLRQGRPAEAGATLDEALSFAARTGERWSDAELLRIAAAVKLAEGGRGTAAAMLGYAVRTALDIDARFFALRAANDLAALHLDDGRPGLAFGVLAPICARYTEGFDTIDLQRAARLLDRAGGMIPSEPGWSPPARSEAAPAAPNAL